MTETEIRTILADYDIDNIRLVPGYATVYTPTRRLFSVVEDRIAGTRLQFIGTGYSAGRDLHYLNFRILPEPAP